MADFDIDIKISEPIEVKSRTRHKYLLSYQYYTSLFSSVFWMNKPQPFTLLDEKIQSDRNSVMMGKNIGKILES